MRAAGGEVGRLNIVGGAEVLSKCLHHINDQQNVRSSPECSECLLD